MVIAGVNVDHQHLIDLTRTHFIHKKPVWFKEGEKVDNPDRSIAQYTGGMIKVPLHFVVLEWLNRGLDKRRVSGVEKVLLINNRCSFEK